MPPQAVVSPVEPGDFQRVVDVWEASVRATHPFVAEADIQFFKPLVRDGLPLLHMQIHGSTDAHSAMMPLEE